MNNIKNLYIDPLILNPNYFNERLELRNMKEKEYIFKNIPKNYVLRMSS